MYMQVLHGRVLGTGGCTAAGDSSSSSELDNKNEYDKGAFDTVTRATTNHGLHRGSFQCNATIYMKDGNHMMLHITQM